MTTPQQFSMKTADPNEGSQYLHLQRLYLISMVNPDFSLKVTFFKE